MAMFDDGLEDGRRADLAFGAEGVRPLHHAPAVVAAFFDLVDHVPKVLADFARPEVAGLAVERESPRLPQAVSVDFREGPLGARERVVERNAVILARSGVVDIEAENLGENARQV